MGNVVVNILAVFLIVGIIVFVAVSIIIGIAGIIGVGITRNRMKSWNLERNNTKPEETKREETPTQEDNSPKVPEWIEEPKNIVYTRERWLSPTLIGKKLLMLSERKVVEVKVLQIWYNDGYPGIQILGTDGETFNCRRVQDMHNFFNTIEDCKNDNFIEFCIPSSLRWIIEEYNLGQWDSDVFDGKGYFFRWIWDGVKAEQRCFIIHLDSCTEEGLCVQIINGWNGKKELLCLNKPINQEAEVWSGTYPTKEECEKANEIEIVRFNE